MATIRIAEQSHPKSHVSDTESGSPPLQLQKGSTYDDGVYNVRSRSRNQSYDARLDEDSESAKEGDYRKKQVFTGKIVAWLAYQSIGVIYGDIGTSPLYVYSSTFSSAPSHEDLVGVLSLIIWSVTIMVTVKYVLIVTRADNEGEGGTFSTYSLLSRYMNITNRDPREKSFVKIGRHPSEDLERAGRTMRKRLESSKFARALLRLMGCLAVSMVLSDGVLTPAQSVLGAVQGARVVNPNLSLGAVIGITDAILVALFLVQPLGITKITFAFSPIVIIWLGFNAVFGIYNLAKYDASVFKAWNPGYSFDFLIRHGEPGWKMLGGVLLAFTGVEALFADLGAFSRKAVMLSWLCYVYPCLMLAYIGQAAYISVHPDAYDNPFFKSVPSGTIYPALIIAILAAVVASQAIITATFQLLHQIMKLSYFPQLKIVHTSRRFHGQLYIPLANWLLMIGTILVASIYNNTTSLGNAYGVCVMFVTFFDTCMVTLTAIFVWRIRPYLVIFPWLIIACVDGTFLSSALTKVPTGAWFTLTLAFVLGSVFLLWRFGKEQQWSAEAEDRFSTSHFIRSGPGNQLSLTDRYNGELLNHIKGFGIFFDKAGEKTPIVFSQFVTKLVALPEVAVFFHLRPLETPSVGPEERFTVSRLAVPNCYRVIVRYGFNDVVISPDLAAVIYEHIKHYKVQQISDEPNLDPMKDRTVEVLQDAKTSPEKSSSDSTPSPDPRLTHLEDAYKHSVLYIVGKEQMRIKKTRNPFRTVVLWIFLWIRDNTRTKIAQLNIPRENVIEVGYLKEI